MAVEHTPSEIVHRVAKGGITGCGTNTKDEPDHWKNTSKEITCNKNGCK